MGIFGQIIRHYGVEIGAAAAIAIMTSLWRTWSMILTSVFGSNKVFDNWETMLDRGAGLVRHEEVTLNQFIHFVWGTTVAQDGMRYRQRGTLTGDRLRIVYAAKNGGTDGGAMLLEVSATGKTMTGFEIGIDQQTDQIYAYPYKWTRRP
jgi:hypothetical protein